MRRLAILALLTALAAPAYYHFARYQTAAGPYVPVYDRFDLNALPGKTAPFLISSSGPAALAPGDSPAAVISQIRAAAAVWNSVETAELKLKFGGFYHEGTVMTTPWIQVEFTDELPPGIIAEGGPVSRLDAIEDARGAFVPIARSLLRLPKDLSSRPSYSERFFLTVVHEFGHTLGLQHTWTSGVMSTEITRSTTKAQPLSADDVAGLSVLYPTSKFGEQTGRITGRVTMGGTGVALASVVALAPNRRPVSTLTDPDGYFRIEGIPPGQYFVYSHPLPPSIAGEPQPVNLELPVGPAGRIYPGVAFDTIFYPGTGAPGQPVTVEAGQTLSGIDFSVTARQRVDLYAVQTYSFLGQEAIKPATFTYGMERGTVVFTGYGAAAPSSGLSMSLISAPEYVAPGSLRAYAPGYLQADVILSPFSSPGPRHLLFSNAGETYVLPAGISVTPRGAPAIQAAVTNPDGTLALSGPNLDESTSVWVDGAKARTSFADGVLVVTPPPAPSGHEGVLVAFNPDGQSSLYVHGADSPRVNNTQSLQPEFAISPIALPAGVETVIEIAGAGVDFTKWTPALGLGTSDAAIRQIWPVSSNRALAWVSTAAGATPGYTTWTASVGLFTKVQPQGFQILPPSRPPHVLMSWIPKAPVYPGSPLVLPLANVSAAVGPEQVSVLIADQLARVVEYSSGQLGVVVPSSTPVGPAVVRIWVGGVELLPAVVQVDPAPPMILTAQTLAGVAITPSNPARLGDVFQLVVANLSAAGEEVKASQIVVRTGEERHNVYQVSLNPAQPGTHLVQISLSAANPSDSILPLTISVSGREALSAFVLPFKP